MNTHHGSLPFSGVIASTPDADKATSDPPAESSDAPTGNGRKFLMLTPFWRERFFEGGLILSMLLYYIVGNPMQRVLYFEHLSPLLNQLIAFPFLLVFAVLCWYRLPVAIALLPLSLPFYVQQRAVVNTIAFSMAEVTLAICLLIVSLHLLFKKSSRFSLAQLKGDVGPFLWPIAVFVGAATISIFIAYDQRFALRAFHEEVLAPLLYLGLAVIYLRSRQDLLRLLVALLGVGLLVALLGLGQYFFFYSQLAHESGGLRVHAMYGSANSIGLLFDYVLPLGLAVLLARVAPRSRLLALVVCIVMLPVLCLTASGGAWVAISVAVVFILALSLRNRKLVLYSGLVVLVIGVGVFAAFHAQILDYILERHSSAQGGPGSIVKRFYLWQSAWHMIQHSPWLGYGMDNWLCYYSRNTVCPTTIQHYWITLDSTGHLTGLKFEPKLSHPHNIFLHVWVSMGIFGLLAFLAVIALFFRLFARILKHLKTATVEGSEQLRWMTIGVGAGMLAALVQGMIDSAFLEQDLAFCFWMLVTALLLLRMQAGVSWRR